MRKADKRPLSPGLARFLRGARLCTIVCCGLVWFSLSSLLRASAGTPIEPFEATYRIDRSGITVGEVLLQIDLPDEAHYRMHFDLHLTGLVSLVFGTSVEEEVHGELIGGTPRPLTYRSERGGSKARTLSQTFEWTRGDVAVVKDGEETVLALQSSTVDPLSLHYLIMLDLRAGSGTTEYSVVSSSRLKTYRLQVLGEAAVKTPLGEFETLIVSRQRLGSDKTTTSWHAPELGFLPVQIAEVDDGEETARLILRELRRFPEISIPTRSED